MDILFFNPIQQSWRQDFARNDQVPVPGELHLRGRVNSPDLTALFLMKAMWPDNVHLLRGCQEFSSSCESGDLKDEVSLRENNGVYGLMIQTFNWLPYAAVVNDRVFCVSGGIGRDALE